MQSDVRGVYVSARVCRCGCVCADESDVLMCVCAGERAGERCAQTRGRAEMHEYADETNTTNA